MKRLACALLALGLTLGGCYAQKRPEPEPHPTPAPTAKPAEPFVGLVPLTDISGHDAGPTVTEILQKQVAKTIKVVLLPGQGFLTGTGMSQALKVAAGNPVIQGRVSAFDFQRRQSRRLGPPDYDIVEARAVVSLSLRVVRPSDSDPEGEVVWSRSLTGEERAVWGENFRQEIGANPLADSFSTPGGLMGPRPAAQMLAKAAERAIELAAPDLLRLVSGGNSVVTMP